MSASLLVAKERQLSFPFGLGQKQAKKQKSKKIGRKCATVAPYSMFYRFLCNALQRARQKTKKYGANAPQLHPILCPSRTNQAIARSWHCQKHSAILLYTAESTCSFCLEHLPYYPGKRRRATNGVLVAKNFSGGGWSGRIGWRRILYIDASPTSQDTRRIAPARPT